MAVVQYFVNISSDLHALKPYLRSVSHLVDLYSAYREIRVGFSDPISLPFIAFFIIGRNFTSRGNRWRCMRPCHGFMNGKEQSDLSYSL